MDAAQLNAFGLSSHSAKSGTHAPDNSPTSSLSNTVSISEPGEWLSLDEKTVEELSEFGDVARLDISLGAVLRCVLVTYFDVRCAQRLLLNFCGRAESFPPAAHDCRIVSVNVQAFAAKALMGGFAQFGEVANISMVHGDAIVEFYDMRSAQFLLAAAGGSATPWTPDQSSPAASMSLSSLGLNSVPAGLGAGLGASIVGAAGASGAPGLGAIVTGQSPTLPLPAGPLSRAAQQKAGLGGSTPTAASQPPLQIPLSASSRRMSEASLASDMSAASPTAGSDADKPKAQSNRPVRTKVTTKDFSKYDIDPEKIQCGEDQRTTVMVRNLTGPRARKEFLQFLERCGLADRYTFFYMPCKEHRNVPAGFAFLNLVAASDVHKLFVMVKSGFWREFLSDPQSKAPAMSYARFQGHDELTKHFSSSAVLHEQDPEKRPIFRPDAGKNSQESPMTRFPPSVTATPKAKEASESSANAQAEAWDAPSGLSQIVQGEAALHTALEKGAREIAAILMRQNDKSPPAAVSAPPGISPLSAPSTKATMQSNDAPAYISIPSAQEISSKGAGAGAGAMRLQGIQEDGDVLDSEQMGA